MPEAPAIDPLSTIECDFVARAVRRKTVFRSLSIAGIAIAGGLAILYGWERLQDPSFPLGARIALIVLILLNARQNLRQYKYAVVLEKLTRP
ncbi:MAG: hypothetical protein IT294_14925 [Deltaproteobacteria bacterium]|nr:hypothetical protein [Deltaproteobacteria bacterium]